MLLRPFPRNENTRKSRLSNRPHSQRFQYPVLRDFVGNITTPFQGNGPDNRIQRMGQDEIDSGVGETKGLGIRNQTSAKSKRKLEHIVTNLPG